jgi:FAD/FMN-containing dehydrogenase
VSKVAHYLQEHLSGEVTASAEVRRHFAHDASVLSLAPAIVAYPRNENDVRKAARFAWQLAERGRRLPITARGGGSDTSGAAIGKGVVLVFTAHMNKILSLDPGKSFLIVEPGITYDKIEQTLYTHGLFLPPYPASQHYATIGGALANNAIGEKTVKYGPTSAYVEHLRVVLANGEVIETGPLSRRELSKKMGLPTFEGEIYRSLDGLLEENEPLISRERARYKAVYNTAGYNLFDVKSKEGFNLAPLFVGSQGTLGIITEAVLSVAPHNPLTQISLISLAELNDLDEVLPKIMELKPSVLDMLNKAALAQIAKVNPNQLVGALQEAKAAVHLFVEFDEHKEGTRKKRTKQLQKIAKKVGASFKTAAKPDEQDDIWKLRQSVATILTQPHGHSKAVPIAEDVCVPLNNLVSFLSAAEKIYTSAGLPAAAWGHAGSGVVRMQPILDLGNLGDRQKMFKVSEAIYETAIRLGGSITASAGEGRTRAPYARWQFGPELHGVMLAIKKIFDPHDILNPGVKTATLDEFKALIRGEYNLGHHHEHLPRS